MMSDEANQFSDEEKNYLYILLVQHGFKPIAELHPKLLDKFVPGRSPDEIKSLLQSYKKTSDEEALPFWITKIMKWKENRTTNYEHLYDLFADIMQQKGQSLPVDDDYRQIYLFLAEILRGNVPNVSSMSSRSITAMFLLLHNLDRLVRSIDSTQLLSCLDQSASPSETPSSTAAADNSEDLLSKQLLTLFKFHKIDEFFNPLRISPTSNRLVYESFFK